MKIITLLSLIILGFTFADASVSSGGGGWARYKALVQIYDENDQPVKTTVLCKVEGMSDSRDLNAIDLKNCFTIEPEILNIQSSEAQ